MNARLYDPVLGRMISPDNFVNGAFASQAYNRYSYANNNPLKYTDPSGNNPILVAMAISAVINIAIQVVQNGGFDNFSFESLLFSVVQGGISAGMAGTIGDGLMASKLTGFTKLAAGIALHALSGGLQAAVFGGNVWQGAISGAVGHLVGEELNRGASKLLGRATDDLGLLGYFVTGGGTSAAVAYATGGDPMQAFIIGGATAAFNSFLHDKPKHKKLPAVPKHNANFHGHGLEPVYIEFDIISGYETAKGLYFGAKAAIKWGLGKAGVSGVNPGSLIRTESGRTWTKSTRKVAEIMNSAKTRGILEPVDIFVHNGKSYIINGHHRVHAAMRLGQNVPVNYLSSPTNYSNIFELQNAAYKASLSPFKVDGRMLKTLLE